MGKRGSLIIPAGLRKRYGFEEGSFVIAEERADGLLLRPATVQAVEVYSDEQVASFLLSNAIGRAGYEAARKEVKKMGLDPDRITHVKPGA